jgi:hypothetical protein
MCQLADQCWLSLLQSLLFALQINLSALLQLSCNDGCLTLLSQAAVATAVGQKFQRNVSVYHEQVIPKATFQHDRNLARCRTDKISNKMTATKSQSQLMTNPQPCCKISPLIPDQHKEPPGGLQLNETRASHVQQMPAKHRHQHRRTAHGSSNVTNQTGALAETPSQSED